MNMGDLLCISETWLTDTAKESDYKLEHFSKPHFIKVGLGKGLATYLKRNYQPRFNLKCHVEEYHLQIAAYKNDHMSVVSVYRSQECSLEKVKNAIVGVIKLLDSHKPCIIGGDFNICAVNQPDNILTKELQSLGFHQMITEATHEKGNCLDHLYFRDNNSTPIQVEVQSVYWSDHDAITVMVPVP